MKVTVKILKGGECSPELNEDDSVQKLKQLVTVALGVPVCDQRLVFKGKTLPDDKNLCECNVTDGSKIFLMIKKSESPCESSSKATPNLWVELNKFLLRHFSDADAQIVLDKCRETFEVNLATLSLDDIERLAASHLQQMPAL